MRTRRTAASTTSSTASRATCDALLHAPFIGFIGTPIELQDANTWAVVPAGSRGFDFYAMKDDRIAEDASVGDGESVVTLVNMAKPRS